MTQEQKRPIEEIIPSWTGKYLVSHPFGDEEVVSAEQLAEMDTTNCTVTRIRKEGEDFWKDFSPSHRP